jgi:hypothetical protein
VAGDGRVLRRSAEAATPREAPAQRGEARWVSHTPPAPAPGAAPRGRGSAGSRTGARGPGGAPPPALPGASPEAAAAHPLVDAADASDVVHRPVEPLPAELEPTAPPSSAAPPRPPGSSDLAARRSGP